MSKTYTEYSYFNSVIISPSIPTNLKLDQIENNVRLSWLDSATYEDGFIVERKKENGQWKRLYFVQKNHDLFIDYSNFSNSDTYYYRIRSYIILSNQHYLISPPSEEKSITISISSFSSDENAIEIEFGNISSYSVYLNEKIRIYIKDFSVNSEYVWFNDAKSFSMSSHGQYADLFPIEKGSGTVVVKRSDDNLSAILNINVLSSEIEDNPAVPLNLRSVSNGNSSICILWNYSEDISHFEIYRIEKTSSSSKNNLIDYSDLNKNKISFVGFDPLKSIYNFYDYGLKTDTTYLYAVVAISRNNKSSLYRGKNRYDYILNKKYISVKTDYSEISIEPSLAYVEPGSSLYMSINSEIESFSNVNWSICTNNSESELINSDKESVYFNASDKNICKDDVIVEADSYSAKSRIIITETI